MLPLTFGADTNEKGKTDAGEMRTTADMPGPGDGTCCGNSSDPAGGNGIPEIVEVKAYLDGHAAPVFSDTNSIGCTRLG